MRSSVWEARDALLRTKNRVVLGGRAPRMDERLWIDPSAVRRTFADIPARSGIVLRRWPPARLMELADHPHVQFAVRHWREGVPWEQTGVFDYMLERIAARGQQDGCRTMADVRTRFARLDQLYEEVGRTGRLKTRSEVVPDASGERGGILIHVAPDGEPVIGASGKHRLTIAQLHGLEVVPVWLGMISREALGRLPDMRAAAPM